MLKDFAKCKNKDCPSRLVCSRYLLQNTNNNQVYALFQPDENGKCEYFIQWTNEPSISVWKTDKYEKKYNE